MFVNGNAISKQVGECTTTVERVHMLANQLYIKYDALSIIDTNITCDKCKCPKYMCICGSVNNDIFDIQILWHQLKNSMCKLHTLSYKCTITVYVNECNEISNEVYSTESVFEDICKSVCNEKYMYRLRQAAYNRL